MCTRVSKSMSRISRDRAARILKDLNQELKKEYKFTFRLVGSANRNTIIEDSNGWYDLDYQILLTHNSKSSLNAQDVKPSFLGAFDKIKKDYEIVENSTTAITVIDNNHKYSIDFVIIKILDEPNLIIKRANHPSNTSHNRYVWNPLPKINSAYIKFDEMSAEEKQDVCDNFIIPRKCQEKMKSKTERISSLRIFVEEVNSYGV
jgi:hypothetical protein